MLINLIQKHPQRHTQNNSGPCNIWVPCGPVKLHIKLTLMVLILKADFSACLVIKADDFPKDPNEKWSLEKVLTSASNLGQTALFVMLLGEKKCMVILFFRI